MELTFELPGTPEQVFAAVATGNGISSWFIPTEVDEVLGGTVHMVMGEGMSSTGRVTAWEPPGRFAMEEPDWADLSQHPGADVTPMITEFLVEARSGGTCVLRVVTSAFGTGADWEQEFFADMERSWLPFFDNLRLYLSTFPDQEVTNLSVGLLPMQGDVDQAWTGLRRALGAFDVGKPVEANGITGAVERSGAPPGPRELLVRLSGPVPGFLEFFVHEFGGSTVGAIEGYLFSPDAPAYVAREQAGWAAWLEGVAAAVV
jgi:uncharacterized protein YndB with AHSA1/START domain